MKLLSAPCILAAISVLPSLTNANSLECSWDPTDDFSFCIGNCGQYVRVLPEGEACKRDEHMRLALPKPPQITTIQGDVLYMDDPGENVDLMEAHCPMDWYATGGGWLRLSGDMEANVAYDGPIFDDVTGDPTGWTVRLEAEGGGSHMRVQTYAICIKI